MAYKGGYAGGYADTAVPTPTVGPGIWQRLAPPRETRQTSRTRYRLTIISSGAISHSDPEPITVGANIGGDTTHHRHERLATTRIDGRSEHEHRAEHLWRSRTGGGGTIPDPDEWIIFL